MAWHKDKQIQADVGIFRSLFPEQTKTPARVVIWSFILLADLILCAAGAFYFGIINLENFSKWMILLILFATIVLFWLEGVICGAVTTLFKKAA